MKKSLWIAAALLGALAAAGCQSEKMEPEQPSGPKTLKVIAESEDTRTGIFLDESTNKYKVYWSENDEIALLEMIDANASASPSTNNFAWSYSPVNTTFGENGRTAIFEFELDDRQELLPENEVFRYMGVYPLGAFTGIYWTQEHIQAEEWELLFGEELTSKHMVLIGEIHSEQCPSSDSFDPECDVLISRIIEAAEQPEELRFNFARLGSIAKITLKGLPAGYYVTEGTFAHGSSWQGSEEFVYDSKLERVLPVDEALGLASPNPITFKPQGVQVNDAGEAVIWLRTLSGKLTDWFTIDVSVSPDGVTPSYMKFSKHVELDGKSITFREGGLSSFSVTLEGQSLISFDEDTTLKFFPELTGGGEAVIRIPKNYSPEYNVAGYNWEYGYPFFFYSVFSWNVSIEFPYGYTEDDEWISVEKQDAGYYLKVDSHTDLPETATLVLTCTDDPDVSPIRIPIEGFNTVTLKKDGYYLDPMDWSHDIFMTSGQTSTFTAEIRLPSWVEMVPNTFRWTVLDDDDESPSYEVGQDNSLTVTAGDKGFIVDGTIECIDNITESSRETDGYVYVSVYPRSIPLKWNDVDWDKKTLYLTFDETVTIQADLSGSSGDIVSFDWNWSKDGYGNMEYSESADDPHSVEVSAGSWLDGATLELSVEMSDGQVYNSFCGIDVTPIVLELKRYGTRLYGDPIVLSPGKECELKATINFNDFNADEYVAKWRVPSGRYISVNYYEFNRYVATVTAEAPGDDYVIFELWRKGEYQHLNTLEYSLEYPIHVSLGGQ